MFRLSTEVRTVIPWRLATPLSAVGAQLRINSSLVALLAGNAKKRVTSPSQARNLRFTLTFISSPPLAVSPLVLISTFSLGYGRSEEHTSELQSRLHLVCRLLLEKKKKKK